ncbi:MAG: polysaccharide lyase [Mesorhizobium sp.]
MRTRAIRTAGLAAAICACCQVAASFGGQVLRDGFDGSDFAEAGGLYYKDNFEQGAGTLEFQKSVSRDGGGALKLSVKAHCSPPSDSCSERAEIWEKTKLRVPYNEGVWYGFAVKFADPIPRDDHRYLIAQWKREIDPGAEGDFSPFLALRLRQGKLFATVETNYLPPARGIDSSGTEGCEGTPVWLRPETNQMRALVATDESWTPDDNDLFHACTNAITITDHGNKLPAPASGWIDFAVYTKPGPDGSGRIELFANGKPVVTVKGHIGHADKGLGKNQYFKFGPYRAAHSGDWTVYYDDFRRSPNCADVLSNGPCPLP